AYWIRFEFLPVHLSVPPFTFYLWFGAVLTPIALPVLRSFKLYRSARTAPLSQELLALVEGIMIVTALVRLSSYFTTGELSRASAGVVGGSGAAPLRASRIVIGSGLRAVRRSGRNLRHTLIVGTGDLARVVIEKIRRHADFGLHLEGLVATDPGQVGATIEGH